MITRLKFTDIKIRNILFQHMIVLLVGLLLFYLEQLEIASLFWEKLILILISLGKCFYFIEHSFRKIEEASPTDITFNWFLAVILTNVLLIVVSFAVDYSCLELIQPSSFKGLSETTSLWDKVFEFCYFSVLSFTTVAYGDIVPVTKTARCLAMFEVGVAYLTTMIIISNFVQIKESISKAK